MCSLPLALRGEPAAPWQADIKHWLYRLGNLCTQSALNLEKFHPWFNTVVIFLKFLISFGHGAPHFHFAEGAGYHRGQSCHTIRFPDVPGPRVGRKLRSHCLVPSLQLIGKQRESHHWGDWPEATQEVRGRDIWDHHCRLSAPSPVPWSQSHLPSTGAGLPLGRAWQLWFLSQTPFLLLGFGHRNRDSDNNLLSSLPISNSYIAYIKHFSEAWRKQQIMESSGLR